MKSDSAKSSPLLLLGLFLLAAGGLLSGVSGPRAYLPRLIMLAGVASVLWGAFNSAASIRFLLFRARAVAEPGPSLNWLLGGAVLLVLAAGLGIRGTRIDVTSRGVNSLSATSKGVLKELSRDVELIAAYRDNAMERDQATEVLAVYSAASRRVKTRSLEPDREPDEARRLGINRPNVLVVRCGEVVEEVTEIEEETITQAILRVQDPNRPVVAVLDGHGETSDGRSTLASLRGLLARSGLVFRLLRLGDFVEVPREIRTLIVLGPTSPLLPGEVEAIERFINRGGRLALFVEPETTTGLEPMLARQGILIDGRRILDESPLSRSLGLGPESVGVNRWGEHPITSGLGVGLVLSGATRVGLAPQPVFGTSGTDIVRSGNDARLLPRDGDTAGVPSAPAALPLGIALEWETPPQEALAGTAPSEKGYARLVVIGDSDLARDSHLDLYGNREFIGRICGWLTERTYLLRFPPVDRSGTPLRVGLAGLQAIFYGVEILVPLLAFGLAFRSWARRR